MKRRTFVATLGAGLLASACKQDTPKPATATPVAKAKPAQTTYEWKMVTTWPKGFPGLGTGALNLANLIEKLTAGAVKVTVFGAGELVAPFEIFDAVSKGQAEMGHGAAYYWTKKVPGAAFFAAVPFGLNAQEMNAWLYQGGGMELWREAYEPFGLTPTAAGNTGVQMAGWFNKEINSPEDLRGLKMRIPGLGGQVLAQLGGEQVNLPGGELFAALKSGRIDATEWVGPYNDLALGLYKAAKYYYYPGWHEPGTCIEAFINTKALRALPADLQQTVLLACKLANYDMLSDLTTQNNQALETLINQHNVALRALPDSVLRVLRERSESLVAGSVEGNQLAERIYDSYVNFRDAVSSWHTIADAAYYSARKV